MAKGNYGSVDVNPRGKLGEISTKRKKTAKRLSKSVSLLGAKKIKGKSKREGLISPAKRASTRLTTSEKAIPLSKSLSEIATATPPGRGRIGRAFKAGLAGASLGALVSESIGKARVERAKRAKQDLGFAKERLGSAALDVMDASERLKKKG